MKSTKKSLLMSALSLLLCFTMLLGTTFAWFTDEVTSGVNQIVAGNLDVELYAGNTQVKSDTMLFDVDLWEPGMVVYENFTVKNVGNLALKYQLGLSTGAFNKVGEHSLKDVLKATLVPEGFSGDREAAQELPGYTTLENFSVSGNGALLPGESQSFAVVIYWQPTDNDNLYNLNNGKTATTVEGKFSEKELGIELGVKLFATQLEYEKDSFDEHYDANANLRDNYGQSVAPVSTTVSTTIKENEDTVFTAAATPANENGKTTKVTVPKEVAKFVAGNTSSMTVVATPTVAANNKFTVSTNGAVGAIDLTVKVNDEVVTQFMDKNGAAIPVTVETYIAKNLTDVSLSYNNGAETWEQVDNESNVTTGKFFYDKATGRMVYGTTHFSTFVLGANEVAYVESNNTAYLKLEDAMKNVVSGDTVTMLKDYYISAQTSGGVSADKVTFDLNKKTITSKDTWLITNGTAGKPGPINATICNGTYVLDKTGSGRIRFEKGSTGVFEDMTFKTSDGNWYQALQTYATNATGADEVNIYSFKECTFENCYTGFEGSSGSCNNYIISFDNCEFNAQKLPSTGCIDTTAYVYGKLNVKDTRFDVTSTVTTGCAITIKAYASYLNGNTMGVTLDDVTISGKTSSSSNGFYPLSIANETATNCPTTVTLSGENNFTRNGVKCTMTSNTPVYSVASKNADGTDKMVQNKNSASQLKDYTNSYQYYNVVITLLNEYGESMSLSGQTLVVPKGIEYSGTVTAANNFVLIETEDEDGNKIYSSVQAEFNGVKQTLIEALMAQQAAGSGEVKLLCGGLTYPTSNFYSNLKMKEGMTLNLNGFTLTKDPLVVSGFKVVLTGDIYSVVPA